MVNIRKCQPHVATEAETCGAHLVAVMGSSTDHIETTNKPDQSLFVTRLWSPSLKGITYAGKRQRTPRIFYLLYFSHDGAPSASVYVHAGSVPQSTPADLRGPCMWTSGETVGRNVTALRGKRSAGRLSYHRRWLVLMRLDRYQVCHPQYYYHTGSPPFQSSLDSS